MHPRVVRIARWTAVASLALSGLLPGTASAAAATEQFDVLPAPGSSTDERGSYFVVDARPGQARTQSLTITNPGSRPVALQLRAVAASTGPLGGVTYEAVREGERAQAVDWLRLDRTQVTVHRGRTAVVDFTVLLPDGARAGDHLAGISVEPPRATSATKGPEPSGASAGVVVRTRQVIAVQATAPGASDPSLAIDGVAAEARADGMYLVVRLDNDGTTMLKASGRIEVAGDAPLDVEFPVDTFLPDTSIEYPVRWTDAPEKGSFPADVALEFDGQVVRWSGSVEVGDRELESYGDRSGERSMASALPWYAWIAMAAALVFPVAAIIRRRMASGRGHVDDVPRDADARW